MIFILGLFEGTLMFDSFKKFITLMVFSMYGSMIENAANLSSKKLRNEPNLMHTLTEGMVLPSKAPGAYQVKPKKSRKRQNLVHSAKGKHVIFPTDPSLSKGRKTPRNGVLPSSHVKSISMGTTASLIPKFVKSKHVKSRHDSSQKVESALKAQKPHREGHNESMTRGSLGKSQQGSDIPVGKYMKPSPDILEYKTEDSRMYNNNLPVNISQTYK